jgi:hypothetical protein
VRGLSLYLTAWLSMACSMPAQVPEGRDASPDADPCGCPTGDLLADYFVRHEVIDALRDGWRDLGITCDPYPGRIPVSGGCLIQPFNQGLTLSWTGFLWDDLDAEVKGWTCRWHNGAAYTKRMITAGLCLQSEISSDAPPECDCPPVQPFSERIYPVRRSTPFIPGRPNNTVVATCEPGDVLLSGSCTTSPDIEPPTVTLSRAGFDRQDEDFWQCTWNHTGDTEAGTMFATILCMRPPDLGTAPETEPLADRVMYYSVSHNMGTQSPMTNSVPCRPGELLLGGGCMFDSTHPDSYQCTLNLFAEDDYTPNVWRCGWHNPTPTMGIAAVTTAICLRPPGP